MPIVKIVFENFEVTIVKEIFTFNEDTVSDFFFSTNSKKPNASQTPYCERYNSGFPPNVTVDELCLYRKRRQGLLLYYILIESM